MWLRRSFNPPFSIFVYAMVVIILAALIPQFYSVGAFSITARRISHQSSVKYRPALVTHGRVGCHHGTTPIHALLLHCSFSDEDSTLSRSTPSTSISSTKDLTSIDRKYMDMALSNARIGAGGTYPNPAVGCVLVNSNDEVIGQGFHPKAGMPHAEVFALLEASGHVDDGIAAARSVLPLTTQQRKRNGDANSQISKTSLSKKVHELLQIYSNSNGDGAHNLFLNCCAKSNTTAYVTLEPCCHTGRTPPCAGSLVQAGVNRVVVGFCDPNPKVDGGGVTLLRNAGIKVDLFSQHKQNSFAKLVQCFVKRITTPTMDYDTAMTGRKRRFLRSLANQQKRDATMADMVLSHHQIEGGDVDAPSYYYSQTDDPRWMEELDAKLWKHELVTVRMNTAISKKRDCKELGMTIAQELNAHVAQTMGKTVLLYRPGQPPVLDLENDIDEKDDS